MLNKKELISLLKVNNALQPKAKYSNNIIITMLENLPDTFTADTEPTRNGLPFNRGSLVECIIKAVVYGDYNQTKSHQLTSDLNTSKLSSDRLSLVNGIKSNNIEIKFSTSFAPATAKHNQARKTIIVCDYGIFMIDSRNIKTTKAGKININNQDPHDLTQLTELMDLLGY